MFTLLFVFKLCTFTYVSPGVIICECRDIFTSEITKPPKRGKR